MNRRDWQEIYGNAPEDFRRGLTEALDELEEENMEIRRGHKFAAALIAAIVTILALTGGALAARELGLFRMLTERAEPIEPREGAEALVETELGAAENELVRLTVEGAAYDGQGALVQLRFTSKADAAEYALMSDALDAAREDGAYVIEEEKGVDPNTGGEIVQHVLGRRDGRGEIYCSAKVTLTNAEGGEIYMDCWRGEEREDGSIVLLASGMSEQPLGERVTLRVEPVVRLRVKWDEKSADGTWIRAGTGAFERRALAAIEAPMKLSEAERYLELVPQRKLERVEVLRAGVSLTPVRSYFTVEYAYEPLPEEEMGITFRVYDAEGKEIHLGNGSGRIVDGLHYMMMEMQTLDEAPETLYLEPKVIDGPPMERIECKVRETDAPAVTAPADEGEE